MGRKIVQRKSRTFSIKRREKLKKKSHQEIISSSQLVYLTAMTKLLASKEDLKKVEDTLQIIQAMTKADKKMRLVMETAMLLGNEKLDGEWNEQLQVVVPRDRDAVATAWMGTAQKINKLLNLPIIKMDERDVWTNTATSVDELYANAAQIAPFFRDMCEQAAKSQPGCSVNFGPGDAYMIKEKESLQDKIKADLEEELGRSLSQTTNSGFSLPFCLKALFLTSITTASHMGWRDGFSGGNVLDGVSLDPVIPMDDAVTNPLAIYLNLETAVQGDKVMQDFELEPFEMGADHSQKVKAPTISNGYGSKDCVNLPPSTAVSRLNEGPISDDSALTFPVSVEAGEQEKDESSNRFIQRHLLQVPVQTSRELKPVVVANPISDQFIQIGEQYTCDVSKVFSGDYLRLQAAGLPDWLNLEYKQLGSYPINTGSAVGIAVSGNTVFVADEWAGLLILNVSDPSNPQLLSNYTAGSGYAEGVAVSGNTVFVANGRAGLLILNVSDPSNPQLLSHYTAGSGDANGVAVSGNTVFVANGRAGLSILNVSDPSNPQLLSHYTAGSGDAIGVAVSGNTVFVANWDGRIIDFKCE